MPGSSGIFSCATPCKNWRELDKGSSLSLLVMQQLSQHWGAVKLRICTHLLHTNTHNTVHKVSRGKVEGFFKMKELKIKFKKWPDYRSSVKNANKAFNFMHTVGMWSIKMYGSEIMDLSRRLKLQLKPGYFILKLFSNRLRKDPQKPAPYPKQEILSWLFPQVTREIYSVGSKAAGSWGQRHCVGSPIFLFLPLSTLFWKLSCPTVLYAALNIRDLVTL